MAKIVPDRKAKVRFFYAEVEGDDGTIQEGLRSIATTIVRASQPVPPRVVKAIAAAPANGASKNGQSLFDETPVEEVAEEPEVEDADFVETPPRAKSSRTKKSPSYNFVTDLNLRPDGKDSLKQFYAKKSPKDQQAQYAVCLFYLAQELSLTGIGANHIYTCFHDVGVPVPPDILQVARNIANRKGWIDAGNGKDLKITVSGQNFVNHELPTKGKTKP
jgi:hypothetical protein